MSKLKTALLLCAFLWSLPAMAVWDYSLAAQLAMYEGVVAVCQQFAPLEVASAGASHGGRFLGAVPELETAKTTSEYVDLLQEVIKEMSQLLQENRGNEREVCARMLGRS